MHVEFTPAQEKLRSEVRAYYRELFTPELRKALDEQWDELGGPAFREAMGRMGKDGWLTLGWPAEYGGRGLGPVEQWIFWDETYRARAPLPVITVNTVGPMLMKHGSPAQKATILPRIRDGELLVGIGYTEAGAGTDLASLTTRAVLDGDEWVIDGQKVFTTHAQDAEYIWLAARTDPDARKHAGISIFLVPTDVPGFSCSPIHTIGGERTNVTYFEGVRVPKDSLVGPLHGGWGLIVGQLNLERITLAMPGPADKLLEDVWDWACETQAPEGGRVVDRPWVQQNLARVQAKLEALKVLNWRSAWLLAGEDPAMADASAVKVFGTETLIECYRLLQEVTGRDGLVRPWQPGALFGGMLEIAYRGAMVNTFGGGVNEVQRDIIAMAGLGLPRARR